MYHNHVPVIAAAMREDHHAFARGILFAVLSMRQPFDTTPDQLASVTAGDDWNLDHAYLFGFKRDAARYVTEHAATIWRDVLDTPAIADQIRVLCRIPGMGIVKSGFVLQLMGYDIGCLDTRNVKRAGLNPRAYRTDGVKGKAGAAFVRKVDRYVAEVGGRAEELWNVWCEDVAVTYEKTAHQISAMHMAVVPDTFLPF